MSATATDRYTITGGGATTMWIERDANGQIGNPREQTQDERLGETVPPRGEYTLKVVAFAEPFEHTSEKWGVKTKTRLKLQIQGGPGDGRYFSTMVGWSIGPNSNLGRVYRAVTGKEVDRGGEYNVTEILNGTFSAYVTGSDELNEEGKPRYANVSWDTVSAVGGSAANTDDWN